MKNVAKSNVMMAKIKLGYWLGDASINTGGTAPYAWRVLDLLLSHVESDDIEITVICSENSYNACIDLIGRRQAGVKVFLFSNETSLFERLIQSFEAILAKLFKKLGIYDAIPLQLSSVYRLKSTYRWLSCLKIDLLHVPYQLPPAYNLPYPLIVTMHDVQELHYPEFFTPEERIFRAENYWESLRHANGVVVSFNHVKQDLIRYFPLPESKVHICPPPYTQISLPVPTPKESELYDAKYSSVNNFILYPAQTWRHKNHLSLIKALELIRERHHLVINLVCTGRINSFYEESISKYLLDSEVSDQVQFMNIVPGSELYWLYKNCALVVVPTLYEAGSFPLLEAMSLNVPVICSAVTSLPETVGDPRFIFDPLDIQGMSQLILAMLGSDGLRQASIMNGRARISKLRRVDSFKSIYATWCNTLGGC